MVAEWAGAAAFLTWFYLMLGRGRFWLVRGQDTFLTSPPRPAPSVVAVIPARNEAPGVAKAVGSLAAQEYRGKFRIVLDAGHGGWDLGTVGRHGLLEKDLVLDVTERLGKLLQSRLGSEVLFTRSDDTYLPLDQRADRHLLDVLQHPDHDLAAALQHPEDRRLLLGQRPPAALPLQPPSAAGPPFFFTASGFPLCPATT